MNLNTASAISAVVGVPLASVPVGLAIHSTLESLRPKSKLKKWSIRVEHISTVVVSKADMLTSEEMEKFLTVLIRYKEARVLFVQKIKDSTWYTWYGKGGKLKAHADDFSAYARDAWDIGMLLSTEASERQGRAYLSKNAQLSPVVQVSTTNTSLLNNLKGKNRQASSLSEESLDAAKSSEPRTSDSSSCLPNEPSSSSNPPLYSVTVSSVNWEDDLEDDLGSDSNSIAPEDAGAKYNFLVGHQITENLCEAWASQASRLDKVRGGSNN